MKKGPRSRQPKKGARSSLEARVDEDDQSNVEAGREEGDEGEEGEEMTLPEQGNKRTQSSAAAAAARVESEEDHLIDQDQTMPPSDLQRARSSAGQVDSTEDNTFNQEEVSQAKAADDSQMQPSTAAGIDDEDKDDEGASFGDDLIMPLPIPNNRRKRIQSSAAGTGDDAGPAPKSAKTNADPTSKPTPRRRGPGKARVQREAGDMTGPRRTGKAQSKAATKDETQNQDQQSVPEYSEDTAVLSVDRRSTGVPQKRKFLDRLIGDQEEADSLKNSVSASTALESTRSGGPSLSELAGTLVVDHQNLVDGQDRVAAEQASLDVDPVTTHGVQFPSLVASRLTSPLEK
ncbi:MAG: hypothetical protein M1837_006933 [Sclerophora amabilis]|nr:MAG: hypothetical protein M1837_006933 [Sclerophora amabilis]